MFRWLNGVGSVFRDPLPGSTNYLNAYDAGGNLIRLRNGRNNEDDNADEGGKGGKRGDEEGSSTIPGEEGAKEDSKNYINGKAIPRETADDLMPFPLNKEFRSQPVLSEALKDEIFRRVTEQGKSVKVVSAEMGVDMSRVGAVVRLKSVEQEWIRTVRFDHMISCVPCGRQRMRQFFSISLEDSSMVTQINYNSLICLSFATSSSPNRSRG